MLTPYAITRAGTEAGEFSDCYGRTLRAVESFGLSLLVGDPIDAECDAEGFQSQRGVCRSKPEVKLMLLKGPAGMPSTSSDLTLQARTIAT